MKHFKVRLSRLDSLDSIAWENYATVFVNGQPLGLCQVEKENDKFVG